MADKNALKESEPRNPLFLSGNEAIARGAIEAGVTLVTGYPGTPSTYVIETLLSIPDLGFRVEWSINEKVAFELATGVSWAGLRSLVTMKMSGLNVASDSFLSVQYSGANGGLVLYVADDPNVYYGMVEQDSRHYARLAAAPMLMPATPQQALEFTRRAFDLSEQIGRPVMIRGTTTLSNFSEMVTPGKRQVIRRDPSFAFNIAKYSKAGPAACVQQHEDTLEALKAFERLTEDLNPLHLNGSRVGVIALGVAWNYLQEALLHYRLEPSTLKIDVAHPLPISKIKSLMSRVDTVVVLEELEPMIEETVLALRADLDHPVRVVGKIRGPLSVTGDYNVEAVTTALREVYGDKVTPPAIPKELLAKTQELKVKRLNTFCAGCPHRATYYALNHAIAELGYKREDVVITGDIGCTILGMNEPFECCWTEISMGSSISLAQGFKYAGMKTPVVATIGDGTFFHAGIPALLNVSHTQTDLTIIILNNQWASMTGMQPNVGTEKPPYSDGRQIVKMEEIIKAAGIRHIVNVNPYQTPKMIESLKAAISSPETAVVIASAECSTQRMRGRKRVSLKVKPELCVRLDNCRPSCIEVLGCPALDRAEDGKAVILPSLCTACGLCHHVCPHGAI
jgi:indolepyruvate ferredoxin oxidoreductase alpha subunit